MITILKRRITADYILYGSKKGPITLDYKDFFLRYGRHFIYGLPSITYLNIFTAGDLSEDAEVVLTLCTLQYTEQGYTFVTKHHISQFGISRNLL